MFNNYTLITYTVGTIASNENKNVLSANCVCVWPVLDAEDKDEKSWLLASGDLQLQRKANPGFCDNHFCALLVVLPYMNPFLRHIISFCLGLTFYRNVIMPHIVSPLWLAFLA